MRKQILHLLLLISLSFSGQIFAQCDAVLSYNQNWAGLPACWSYPNGNANIGTNGFGGQSGGAFIRSRELINLQGTYSISTRTTTNTNSSFNIQLIQNDAVVQTFGVSVSPGNFQTQTFQFNVAGSGYIQIAQLTTNAPFIALGNMTFTGTCPAGTEVDVFTQDITVELDANGTASITPQDIDNGSGDICGNAVTLSIDESTFTCDDLGENSVSFTATRADGESGNAIATVTVEPTSSLSTSNIYLDAQGDASYTLEGLLGSSSTVCDAITYSIDKLNFDCSDLGNNQEVTVTATYGTSTSSKILLVNVLDTIPPSNIVTEDISITLDEATGIATITAEDLFTSATDNCATLFALSVSKTSFTCSDAGENTVLLTVADSDANGNEATVEVTVTVLSTIIDQALTTSLASFCPDGSANAATVDMASSELDVDYFLRNSATDAILDGPIAGTGGALSFSAGSIEETTSVYVFAQSSATETPDFALDFDGSNDKVVTTYQQAATSELTIEGWVYPRAANTNMFLSNYDGSGLEAGDMFFDNQGDFPYTGRALRINFLGTGDVRHILVVQDVLTLNEWNHIAATFDNGTVKLFVDGVEVASNTSSFTTLPAALSTSTFGQHTAATSTPFNGQMDEFRIWNTVRSSAEILSDKDSQLIGSETGLAALYSFDDGSGTVVTDLVNGANGTLTNMDATDWVDGANFVESNICDVRMSTEITFGDNEAPTATTQNISGQIDATGVFVADPSSINNGSSDNCTSTENLSFSLDQTDFNCTMIGDNTVTLTVTDESGNEATATATVTIISAVEDQTVSASETTICPGSETTITMASSQTDFEYTLYNAANDMIVDGPISADGGALDFNTGSISETTSYYVTASGVGGAYSLDFDGQNDRVATTYSQEATNELTIEGWIYPRGTTTNKFFSNYNDSGSLKPGDMFFDIYDPSINNGRGLRMSLVGAGGTRLTIGVPNVLELNSWNHVAYTFNRGVGRLYVDGIEVANGTTSFTSIPAAVSELWFGEDAGNSEQDHFNGIMDEFRVWNTERSASEILANKDSELVGTETDLVAYFDFNDGSGNTVTELVSGANGTLTDMDATSDWIAGSPFSSTTFCETNVGNQVTITVGDTEEPEVVTKNLIVVLNENDVAVISASDIDNGSTDNCTSVENLTITLDITEFDIDDVGDNTVTLSVTDVAGNIGTGTATVTISDKEEQTATFTGIEAKTFGEADFDIVASVDSELPVTFSVVSGGLSVSSSETNSATFTITAAGVASIEVTNDGNDTYAPLLETITIDVAKSDQEITIGRVTDKINTAPSFDISASVVSNLALEYEITSGPATISGNTITLTGELGTVAVGVSQAGNDNYNAASASVSFDVVDKEVQVVTFTGAENKTFGDPNFDITANIDSNLPVTYSVVSGGISIAENSEEAAENNVETFTITGAGTAVIRASNDGNDTYAPLQEDIVIEVAKANQTITVEEVPIKTLTAEPIAIIASVDTELVLTYSLTGPATISENVVTLDGTEGTVTVTVSQAGTDNYNEVSETITFEVVEKQSQTITFTEITDLVYGAADQALSATSSSNLAVSLHLISGPATLTESVLSITGAGDIVVEATQAGDDDFLEASVQQTITVSKADLIISADNQTINYGEAIPDLTYFFTGFVNGEMETDLNATISISTAAGIEEGQANAGSYAITLAVNASESGDNYRFTTENATLIINMLDQIVTVDPIEDKAPTDASFDVVASVDSGLELTYEISGPATISGTTVTLDGTEGTVSVAASQAGDVNHNAATATITFEVRVVLGLGDNLLEAIKLYPNPVTDYIMIDSKELLEVRFYGLNGQLLKEMHSVSGKVDLSDLSSGTYLMEVSNSEESKVLRIHKAN